MRNLLLLMLLAVLVACQSAPDTQSWVQDGKSDQSLQDDYAHCEQVAMQESNGMRSTDVFKETAIKEQCMKRLGYVKRTSEKAPILSPSPY
jgi:Tfp pilus assembly protein PilP